MFPIESLFMHEFASRYGPSDMRNVAGETAIQLPARTHTHTKAKGWGAVLQWQAPLRRWRFLSIMRGGYRYFDVEARKAGM